MVESAFGSFRFCSVKPHISVNEDDSKHKVIPSGEVQIKMKNTVTKIYHVICMLLPLPGNVWSSPNTLG